MSSLQFDLFLDCCLAVLSRFLFFKSMFVDSILQLHSDLFFPFHLYDFQLDMIYASCRRGHQGKKKHMLRDLTICNNPAIVLMGFPLLYCKTVIYSVLSRSV